MDQYFWYIFKDIFIIKNLLKRSDQLQLYTYIK